MARCELVRQICTSRKDSSERSTLLMVVRGLPDSSESRVAIRTPPSPPRRQLSYPTLVTRGWSVQTWGDCSDHGLTHEVNMVTEEEEEASMY